jgi:hypothetical protein
MSILKTTIGKVGAAGLVAAVGLGGLLLTAPAASAAAEGDRLEGPFITRTAEAETYLPRQAWTTISSSIQWYRGTSDEDTLANATETFTFPAAGTTGPIINAAGKCLSIASAGADSPRFLACDGRNAQQFRVEESGSFLNKAGYSMTDGTGPAPSYLMRGWGLVGIGGASDYLAMGYLKPVVASASVDMTGPAEGSTVDTATPVISGTGEPGATVTVKDKDGKVIGTATVGGDKNWSVTPASPLPQGPNAVTVEQDANGTTSTDSGSFTVDVPVVIAEVTAAVKSKDDEAKTAELTGKGQPGATITVTTPTGPVTTTVDKDGDWTLGVSGLSEGQNDLSVTQTVDGKDAGSTTVTVIIDELETPALAGVALFGLTAAGAGLIALRRKRANAAA